MTALAPIFANEANSARLLDLKPAEFRALVEGGHLPKGRPIHDFIRWDVEQLRRIVAGEAVDGMGGVQW